MSQPVAASRERVVPARPAAAAERGWLLPLLLALFFCSGICGLIYQVLWLRILTLVFGVTVFAVSTVLASFMAGLALGSFGAGKLADRFRNPLAVYGLAEILIGATALATPEAIGALQGVYHGLYDLLGGAPLVVGAARLALAFLILLVPTSLMGATLPIVVKSSLLRSARLSQNVSVLYAVNTFGAIVGAASTGFVLIPGLGIHTTVRLAAALNLAVGLAALVAARAVIGARGQGSGDRGWGDTPHTPWQGSPPASPGRGTGWRDTPHTPRQGSPPAPPSPIPQPLAPISFPPAVLTVVFWAFGLSGCLSLAYEVVWSRVLAMFFDTSVYGFTVMLATVLCAIAVGSAAITPVLQRRWNWVVVFGALVLVVALTAVLSILTLGEMYHLTAWLQQAAGLGEALSTPLRFMVFVSFLAIFPPMFFLGMTFPVAARIYAAAASDAGRRVGAIYAANVCGAIFGSLVAGFVLVPRLGSQGSLVLLAAGNALIGLALLWTQRRRLGLRLAAVAAPLAALVLLMQLAPAMYPNIFSGRFPGQEVRWYEESLENTVSVVRDAAGTDTLYINSREQGSSDPGEVRYHRLIGHFGMLLHPDPRDVLVIGLGGGPTPGAVSQWDNARVDVVELSDGVRDAARWFAADNYDVLQQPNVHLRIDDGRNYLLLHDRRYDVVTADIIRPYDAGAANLYSVEYFRLVRDALKPDGLMVQWLPPYSEYQYRLILRTFLEAFPHVTLWLTGDLLVGSKQPLQLDRAALAAKFGAPRTRAALDDVGLDDAQQVLDWYQASTPELRRVAGDGPIITDDFPYVEYFRSLPKDGPPKLDGYSRHVQDVLR
jgi:spermidine synthase